LYSSPGGYSNGSGTDCNRNCQPSFPRSVEDKTGSTASGGFPTDATNIEPDIYETDPDNRYQQYLLQDDNDV
jgi:hypothetical protein